jgi:hypothetical protein
MKSHDHQAVRCQNVFACMPPIHLRDARCNGALLVSFVAVITRMTMNTLNLIMPRGVLRLLSSARITNAKAHVVRDGSPNKKLLQAHLFHRGKEIAHCGMRTSLADSIKLIRGSTRTSSYLHYLSN